MKRILVTGGAGFIGSHLCVRLLNEGCQVVCLDNFLTGSPKNIQHLTANPNFQMAEQDITTPYCPDGPIDEIYNLACPASPIHYQYNPIKTLKTNVLGAINMLDLAIKKRSKLLQASTSEVYGDPAVHPQPETYWGNVNPIGPRSCYDEGKRCAETLCMDYYRQYRIPIKIVRIFNTYGPNMCLNDGRVISNFTIQALMNQDITVYGDGSQTRSFLYIDDLVDEMILALQGKEHHCEFDGVEAVGRADGRYCYVPVTFHATLGEIVDLLHRFSEMPQTLMIPEIPDDSFAKRLFSTYLSYLPADKAVFDLKMNCDQRGSFTELVHTPNCGQVSINISRPGITKGQHWHNSKWEQFIVVKGHGLIQMRREGSDEVLEYEVSGDKIRSVIMLPGYTHNIINLSDTEDLVTVMYCNEIFDPSHPDTFFDPV